MMWDFLPISVNDHISVTWLCWNVLRCGDIILHGPERLTFQRVSPTFALVEEMPFPVQRREWSIRK
ncbi:MAG: hypothetical protein BGP04_04215 [Rhizobiales bacterium 62-17]|nr:MAG: hypothetical protein BGP04_04215 [Rhizobiales bacterium 62-17]